MRSTTHLDWLAVTYPTGTEPRNTFPPAARRGEFIWQSAGRHGYRNLWVNQDGLQVMDEGTEIQGVHAIASGAALENMRLNGVPDFVICHNALYRQGRASRVDVALNLIDTELTVEDFWRAWQKGQLTTVGRGARLVTSDPIPGSSMYIGSRQSSIMMRVYDKAAEQNVKDIGSWIRLEAELKKVRAHAVMMALATTENERGTMNAVIADGLRWPGNREMSEALADQQPTIVHMPRKVTGTMAWLYTQVAPAMAKYQKMHPDEDVLQALTTAFHAIMLDSM